MRMNSRNKKQHSNLKMFNDFMPRGTRQISLRATLGAQLHSEPTSTHASLPPHCFRQNQCEACPKAHGSAGPSGLDADDWRRLLSAFGQTSTNLCKLVAKFAKRLATCIIPPDDLIAYNGCRLVALDKFQLRPIGIGEVMRRITGRIIVD